LDGNPVSVETLKLDVAERADVIVEMNNPGVWAFAAVDDDDRKTGMGVVVEYANRSGEPRWIKPARRLDLCEIRARRSGVRAGLNGPTEVRKSSRRPGRLQPLDDQREVVAGNQPALHAFAG
jgi:FtsP/CotA-like multicopper oxidase with cupredoxin domain